jgi:DMSO/TMAO reductase YedYZ molybdopterin-dependent catalytic subunit
MNRKAWRPGQIVAPADVVSQFRAHWRAMKHLEQIAKRREPVDALAERARQQEITDAWQVARFTADRLAELLRALGRQAECHEIDQHLIRLTPDGELEIMRKPPFGRRTVYPRLLNGTD